MRTLRAVARMIERIAMGRRAYKFIVRDWVRLPDLEAAADVIGTMRFSANVEPVELAVPSAQRIAVIAPHPDDEIIGPGGTLIRSIRRGKDIGVLYLTDGHDTPDRPRVEETVSVAQAVGYTTDFSLLDGDLSVDVETARRLAERIRDRRARAVFVPFVLDDHPEHRMASLLLSLAHDQGVLAGDTEVWAYQVYTSLIPNVVVDITDVHHSKANAIRMWRDSAMRSRDWAHYALGLNAYNSRFLRRPPGEHYVEAFFVLPLADYAEICRRYAASFGDGVGAAVRD